MPRATRSPRAQVIALTRPQPLVGAEWLAVAVALALLAAGLLM